MSEQSTPMKASPAASPYAGPHNDLLMKEAPPGSNILSSSKNEAADNMDAGIILPPLPLDLTQHKLPIAIFWGSIVLTSCLLPLIGYFSLHYATTASLTTIFSIFLSIMGGFSLLAWLRRGWALFRKGSDCRPLGLENSRWLFDYFFWNFSCTFPALTALITAGIVTEKVHIVSLPLSVLVLWVSLQMLLAEIMLSLGMRTPFRLSSLPKGSPLRPGIFVIVDDTVAVDGGQGSAWRQAWNARYLASPALRRFLSQMDLLWGSTGVCVVVIVWGLVFGLSNHDIGYAVGWALPFAWGAVMTCVTILLAKRMLKMEKTVLKAEGHHQ